MSKCVLFFVLPFLFISCISNSEFSGEWDRQDSVVSLKIVVPEEMKEAVWGELLMPNFHFVFYQDSAVFVSEDNEFRKQVHPADIVRLMNNYYDRVYPLVAVKQRSYTQKEIRWRNKIAEDLAAVAAQAAGLYPEAQYEFEKEE